MKKKLFICLVAVAIIATLAVLQPYQKTDKGLAIIAAADAEIIPEGLTEEETVAFAEKAIEEAVKLNLGSDNIIVDVDTQLVSKEYLHSLLANSKENIYFGFTDSQLQEMFGNTMVVFMLDENGKTTVVPYEEYTNPYAPVLRDVAIGAAVILVCVTVSIATAGGATPVVHAVFAAAAKGGAIGGLSGALIKGTTSAVVTAVQTGDIQQSMDAFIINGANGFKTGAIIGAATAGVSKAISIMTSGIPSWRESELAAQEQFGGNSQVAYSNRQPVPYGYENSTRPDLVRKLKDGTLEALEVKNYDLTGAANKCVMYNELRREVSDRVANMPIGTLQRVVLDTRGRGYSSEFIKGIISEIKEVCNPFYEDIPVSLLAY